MENKMNLRNAVKLEEQLMIFDNIANELNTIEAREKQDHGHHLSYFTRAAEMATARLNKRLNAYDVAIILLSLTDADISMNPEKQENYVKSMYYTMLAKGLARHTDADLPKTFLADIEAHLDEQINP